MTVIEISALRTINNPKVLQYWLFSVCFDCLCVVLLVCLCCVTCVCRLAVSATWRTNINGNKKGMGGQRVTRSALLQPQKGCFQSWKPHSTSSKIVLSSITFKPLWWHNTTRYKRSRLLTVYWNVNVLYELEVEQNCASLGCMYPAHGSASNMTV